MKKPCQYDCLKQLILESVYMFIYFEALVLNFSFLKVRPVYSKSPSNFGNLIYLPDWFFDINHFAHFALIHRNL